MNEERKEELRKLADKLGYFGIESQASDAIKELLKEVDRLGQELAAAEAERDGIAADLESAWKNTP